MKTKYTHNSFLLGCFLVVTLMLLTLCSYSPKLSEIPSDYNQEELAKYFSIPTSELSEQFQKDVDQFDSGLIPSSQIEVLESIPIKDSLIALYPIKKTKFAVDCLTTVDHLGFYRKNHQKLSITKEEFLNYYNSIESWGKRHVITTLRSLIGTGELEVKNENVLLGIEEEYEKIKPFLGYVESRKRFEQLHFESPERTANILQYLDTITVRHNYFDTKKAMYMACLDGKTEEVYKAYKRISLDAIAKKNEVDLDNVIMPMINDFLLVKHFAQSENLDLRNDFINLGYEIIQNNLQRYAKFSRSLLNTQALRNDEIIKVLDLLQKSENPKLNRSGEYWSLRFNGINNIKNLSDEYIRDSVNYDLFSLLLKSNLSNSDKKYMLEFLKNNDSKMKAYHSSSDPAPWNPYMGMRLTTTDDYDSISYYASVIGINPDIKYETFITGYEHNYLPQFWLKYIHKPALLDYLIRKEIGYVYYNSGVDSYDSILELCADGYEISYGEQLHYWIERGDENRLSNIYIFTNNSQIYKLKITEPQEIQSEELFNILNTILKEEGKSKRWIPINIKRGFDDYHNEVWLIEPSALSYFNEKVGIYPTKKTIFDYNR